MLILCTLSLRAHALLLMPSPGTVLPSYSESQLGLHLGSSTVVRAGQQGRCPRGSREAEVSLTVEPVGQVRYGQGWEYAGPLSEGQGLW